jgi:hypothetical protein
MGWLKMTVFSIEGILFFGLFVIVLLLAVRRSRIKKEETFENRDN